MKRVNSDTYHFCRVDTLRAFNIFLLSQVALFGTRVPYENETEPLVDTAQGHRFPADILPRAKDSLLTGKAMRKNAVALHRINASCHIKYCRYGGAHTCC